MKIKNTLSTLSEIMDPIRPLAKGLLLTLGLCAITQHASANLTMDLRASSLTGSGAISNGGKTVTGFASGDVITMQVWAEITTVAGTGDFGIQTTLGSIKTTGGSLTGITGTMSTATALTPYNSGSVAGTVSELTGDNSPDLGSNSTSPSTAFPKFRTDPTDASGAQYSGGGTTFFQTSGTHGPNLVLNTNYSTVTLGGQSGYQFLMGTVTFTIGQANANGSMSLNWVVPGFITPANKGTIAIWVEGSAGANGNTNFAELLVGAPVSLSLIAVPEPGTFGMVLLGAASLIAFRRFGLRKA